MTMFRFPKVYKPNWQVDRHKIALQMQIAMRGRNYIMEPEYKELKDEVKNWFYEFKPDLTRAVHIGPTKI